MDRSTTQFDKYTKIWSGPRPASFFDVDCSIGKILFAFMRNHPNSICQISDTEGTALTNGEAITFAIRIAQQLKAMGLKQDDVVGIMGTNTTYLMPVLLGCLLNGTPFHAVSPWQDEGTIKHLFSITRPKLIFCDGKCFQRLSIIARILKSHVYTLKDHRLGMPRVEDLLEPTRAELYYVPETLLLGGDHTVAILCTSGTTGPPKAVCISNSACLFDFGFVTGQDVLLSFSTIDWSAGMFNMLFSCCHGSTRIIPDRPYTPEYMIQLVEKYKVTLLTVVPQQVASLLKSPKTSAQKLRSIKHLLFAGGHCLVATLKKMQSFLHGSGILRNAYGLTEVGTMVSYNYDTQSKPTSVGRLMANIRVKIVDSSGELQGPKGLGEILCHNGQPWSGYVGNPQATAEMRDSAGWYHTGDVGYFDEDHHLHIVERKKDMLKYLGMMYYPHEVEEVIGQMPDVAEVCVFGIFRETEGDAAAASVVLRSGSKLDPKHVEQYVRKNVSVQFKHLHGGVQFVPQLAKSANGKVNRQAVKAAYLRDATQS
ncbi:luciferin 4-monooxygenase [Drosophila sechellia]|uniref:luciferin 4-monooxygenase n=1 Tax=Drosophila sechellia TaxID=7238 RepID=UPI0013DE137D|nr:luciferin 4-monooxygenase [Drosophila sechellia]XP_032582932.1 luciferin 4-monooxygenase [Drosophila sechellia]